ncbi:MAG: site-specific integrase [Lachnospiraceae bacterium]|nr:site-specific integrase [Lachnospiraceae bacterium]
MGRHGENIRKRKDGRWEARIIQGYNADGRARYRYLYGKTYQEVKSKKAKALVEQRTQPASETGNLKITFGQIADEWLQLRKSMVKESTYANYANIIERHLQPELGKVYLSAVTSEMLETFLNQKLQNGRLDGKGGLSTKTVADMRSVIKLVLQYARRRNYPCRADIYISCPGVKMPEIQIFTRQEQARLEKVLFETQAELHLGILIALYGGLRIGEVCALQWGDFNFESSTVTVNKTVIRIRDMDSSSDRKTKLLIERPKTQCSNRTIPLPDFIISCFEKHRKNDELYLLTGAEQFMEPRTCLEKYKRVLRAAELNDFNFHALRHTFATRCVENGFDIKSLSEILGHANVNTTMQRYVHPSMELKKEQMNRLAQVSVYGQNHGQKSE